MNFVAMQKKNPLGKFSPLPIIFLSNMKMTMKGSQYYDIDMDAENFVNEIKTWLLSCGISEEEIKKLDDEAPAPETKKEENAEPRALKVYCVEGLEYWLHYSIVEFGNFYMKMRGLSAEGYSMFDIKELDERELEQTFIYKKNEKLFSIAEYLKAKHAPLLCAGDLIHNVGGNDAA
jgi:hypothetical protein